MNQNDVDKIIAEAVADSKAKSRKKWHKSRTSSDSVTTARRILNWTFMVGFAVALIVYFVFPEQRILFFCIGFSAVALKLVEFYLRFMF